MVCPKQPRRNKMRRGWTFFLLTFMALTWPAPAQEELPYMGRVQGSRVNVRAGSGANSVVLTQLNRGDLVLVLNQDQDWCQIEPPKGTAFWIYTKLLKDGWPKTDGVNVRSGPGTHYAAVCTVDTTTSLLILESAGEWTKIAPPPNARVLISRDYVSYFSSPDGYEEKLLAEERSKELFKEAEAFRRAELRKSMAEIDFEAILKKYNAIKDVFPEAAMIDQVDSRIADTEAKMKVAARELEAAEMRRKRAAVRIPPKETIKTPAKPAKKMSAVRIDKKKKEEVLLSFEGRLRPVKNIPGKIFTHQLQGGFLNTRRLCLLSAPDIDLSSYHNKKVRVWGEFVAAEGAGVSGIRVERIELAR